MNKKAEDLYDVYRGCLTEGTSESSAFCIYRLAALLKHFRNKTVVHYR